ncbi:MAG: DnaJ domain-containing protein [Clostridia bacterium]|jgi:curved DNA-binding protein CbpA|nr:DnaJ domain-containing protein [Clostridia bacterium]
MKNYYDILEVSRKASKDTINKVFKMHMKANHPDLFQGEEKTKAEEKSKELTEAYNILSDDASRARYDEELDAEESQGQYGQIQAIMEENEYLKQVIAQKDSVISRLTGNQYEQYTQTTMNQNQGQYGNPYGQYNDNSYQTGGGYGFNGFTPPPQHNPYEGMTLEELKKLKKEEQKRYYLQILKDFGIKIAILIVIVIVMIISISSSFKDLANLFGK